MDNVSNPALNYVTDNNLNVYILKCFPLQFFIPHFAYVYIYTRSMSTHFDKVINIGAILYYVDIHVNNFVNEIGEMHSGRLLAGRGCRGVCLIIDNMSYKDSILTEIDAYLDLIAMVAVYAPVGCEYLLESSHEYILVSKALVEMYTNRFMSDACQL